MSIALMELYPIVTASVLWGATWARRCVCFYCDNMATVAILRKGRSKSPGIMLLVRRLTLTALKHNFTFTAKHVPGKCNAISDALSRFQMTRFRSLAPEADTYPTSCPPLSDLLFPPHQLGHLHTTSNIGP